MIYLDHTIKSSRQKIAFHNFLINSTLLRRPQCSTETKRKANIHRVVEYTVVALSSGTGRTQMLKRSFFLLLGTMSTFAICCLGLELEGKAGQIEKTLNGGSPCQLTVISSMNENLLQHLHESQLPLVVGSSDYHLLTHLLPEAIHGPRTKEYCWNLVLASDKLEKEDVSGTLLTIANHLLGRYSSKVIITQNELLTKTDILPSVWYGEHFIVDQAGHIQR